MKKNIIVFLSICLIMTLSSFAAAESVADTTAVETSYFEDVPEKVMTWLETAGKELGKAAKEVWGWLVLKVRVVAITHLLGYVILLFATYRVVINSFKLKMDQIITYNRELSKIQIGDSFFRSLTLLPLSALLISMSYNMLIEGEIVTHMINSVVPEYGAIKEIISIVNK